MSNLIDKKTLEYLAQLSRLKLEEKEQDKLLKDLQKILDYFEFLKEVDTQHIEPMSGGTININVFREPKEVEVKDELRNLTDQFLEKEDNYLKIPPVFEEE